MVLFARLLDDAALLPPRSAPLDRAVAEHREHRAAWYADLIAPLVVPDTALAALGRLAGASPVPVRVVNSGGAGGLAALARRTVGGVEVVAVESALRDLDDLAGNAGRIAASATELDPEVEVYVELPYAHGWSRAAVEVEAAGLYGLLRLDGSGDSRGAAPAPAQVVERLSVLVEADLSFRVAAAAYPLANLLLAIDALIDGADREDAEALLGLPDGEVTATVLGWDEARRQRVRRRLRGFGCPDVAELATALRASGLLERAS